MKLVDNVTVLPVVTSLPIPVERVLDGARKFAEETGLQYVPVEFSAEDAAKYAALPAAGQEQLEWAERWWLK